MLSVLCCAVLCCSCPFMERKLQGLKVLADAVTASEMAMPPLGGSGSQGNSPALTPQVFFFVFPHSFSQEMTALLWRYVPIRGRWWIDGQSRAPVFFEANDSADVK